MKILRDHFLREFGGTFVACLLTLFFLVIVGQGALRMTDLVLNKDVDAFLILKLLFFSSPFLLTFMIPMSVLVATLLTFGRLSHDNEILAMRASGLPFWKTAVPLTVAVAVLCLFSFLLSDRVASTSHYAERQLLAQIGIESPAAVLEEGTFIKKFKNFVIFIYEIDKNQLKGIRIYQPQEGKPTRTIVAQRGEIVTIPEKNIVMLRLMHGTTDEPDAKDPSKLYKLNFRTYDLPLNVNEARDAGKLGKKPKDMSVSELRDEIDKLGKEGIAATYPLSAEIHNKIALSLSSLIFLIIGIPLGMTVRRSEKSINFGISFILMTLYWTLLIGGKALAQKGVASPFLCLQFSNAVVGAIGLFLFTRLVRN